MQAIGVISGVLNIFSFMKNNFESSVKQGVSFKFAAGLDGADGPDVANPLWGGGGNLPDIYVFNEEGAQIGKKINDKTNCKSGDTDCTSEVTNVHQQPTYTLFTGNNDALCIAWVTVTFPEQTQYAWVGNWAKQCGGDWYYSDIYVQADNGDQKVECAWVDLNGDRKQTGIQVHWPSYLKGFAANNNTVDYYCKNKPVLNFYTTPDVSNIVLWSRKRNMFDYSPSTTTSPAFEPSQNGEEASRRPSLRARMAKSTSLIKSDEDSHVASTLCGSDQAVGPSFVSLSERKMCHMADKTVYPFCEDIQEGECWDNDKDEIIHKGEGGIVRRASRPAVTFTKTIQWGSKR